VEEADDDAHGLLHHVCPCRERTPPQTLHCAPPPPRVHLLPTGVVFCRLTAAADDAANGATAAAADTTCAPVPPTLLVRSSVVPVYMQYCSEYVEYERRTAV
jgi:hypothetical protein